MFCSIHICPQRDPNGDARFLRTLSSQRWDKIVYASSLWTPRFTLHRILLDDGRTIGVPTLTESVSPSSETLNHRVSVIENFIQHNINTTQEKILLVIDQHLLEHKDRFQLSLEDRLWASQGIVMEVDLSYHLSNRMRRNSQTNNSNKTPKMPLDEPDR